MSRHPSRPSHHLTSRTTSGKRILSNPSRVSDRLSKSSISSRESRERRPSRVRASTRQNHVRRDSKRKSSIARSHSRSSHDDDDDDDDHDDDDDTSDDNDREDREAVQDVSQVSQVAPVSQVSQLLQAVRNLYADLTEQKIQRRQKQKQTKRKQSQRSSHPFLQNVVGSMRASAGTYAAMSARISNIRAIATMLQQKLTTWQSAVKSDRLIGGINGLAWGANLRAGLDACKMFEMLQFNTLLSHFSSLKIAQPESALMHCWNAVSSSSPSRTVEFARATTTTVIMTTTTTTTGTACQGEAKADTAIEDTREDTIAQARQSIVHNLTNTNCVFVTVPITMDDMQPSDLICATESAIGMCRAALISDARLADAKIILLQGDRKRVLENLVVPEASLLDQAFAIHRQDDISFSWMEYMMTQHVRAATLGSLAPQSASRQQSESERLVDLVFFIVHVHQHSTSRTFGSDKKRWRDSFDRAVMRQRAPIQAKLFVLTCDIITSDNEWGRVCSATAKAIFVA